MIICIVGYTLIVYCYRSNVIVERLEMSWRYLYYGPICKLMEFKVSKNVVYFMMC